MAKTKRANYLIDKPFQLGFIIHYVIIIIITVVTIIVITLAYYWIISNFGKFKLDTSVTYNKRGYVKYEGRQVYDYEIEKIYIYPDTDENNKKVFKCYKTFDATNSRYKKGDIIENVNEDSIKGKEVIGLTSSTTTRFNIVIGPLIATGLALVIVISAFSLFFSHRMAGPVYRIRVSLDRILADDLDFKVKVRRNDFFVNIVERLEKLRQQLIEHKAKNGTKKK